MKRCVIVGGAGIDNYEAIKRYLAPDDFYIFCDCGMKHAEKLGICPDLIVGDFDSWSPDPDSEINLGVLNQDLNYRNVHAHIDNSTGLMEYNDQSIIYESRSAAPGNSTSTEDDADAENYAENALKSSHRKYNTDYHRKTPQILVLPHEKFDTDTVYGVREGIERGFDDFLIIGAVGQRMSHTLSNLYILVMLDSKGKKGLLVDDYSDMELVSSEPAYITDDHSGFSLVNITGKAKGIRLTGAKYTYFMDDKISCDYQYGISNQVIPGMTACVSVEEGSLLLIRDR